VNFQLSIKKHGYLIENWIEFPVSTNTQTILVLGYQENVLQDMDCT